MSRQVRLGLAGRWLVMVRAYNRTTPSADYLLCLQCQCKHTSGLGCGRRCARMRLRALSIEIGGCHASVRVLRSIAEGRGQGARARLVVVCILAVVDRRIDRNGPHARCIPIAIAVIILATIARCPHIDVAQAVSAFVHTAHNRSHGSVTWPIDRLAVVGWSPAGAVDVDQVGFVSHRVRLDQVGHVGLVEHTDARHLRVIGDTHPADAIVPFSGHLTSTSCPVTIYIKGEGGGGGVGGNERRTSNL